jgi:hypothetical protein
MVLEPFDFQDPNVSQLTKAIMEISLFLIDNDLLTDQELNTFNNNLISILKARGIPNSDDHNSRKVSLGASLRTFKTANSTAEQLPDGDTVQVSTLQNEEYITDLVVCLVRIEQYKQRSYQNKFDRLYSRKIEGASFQSKVLGKREQKIAELGLVGVDSQSLLEKYFPTSTYNISSEEMDLMLKIDRSKVKEYFKNEDILDLETPRILIELINPEKPELSKTVLEYLNLILRKDELCLKNYRNKFTLNKSIDVKVEDDFFKFYEIVYRLTSEY